MKCYSEGVRDGEMKVCTPHAAMQVPSRRESLRPWSYHCSFRFEDADHEEMRCVPSSACRNRQKAAGVGPDLLHENTLNQRLYVTLRSSSSVSLD
jgi:hypothetical protein